MIFLIVLLFQKTMIPDKNEIKFCIKLFALFLFLAGVPILFAYCGSHEIAIDIDKTENIREEGEKVEEEKYWQLKKDTSGYKNQTLETIQNTIKNKIILRHY